MAQANEYLAYLAYIPAASCTADRREAGGRAEWKNGTQMEQGPARERNGKVAYARLRHEAKLRRQPP